MIINLCKKNIFVRSCIPVIKKNERKNSKINHKNICITYKYLLYLSRKTQTKENER